MCFGNIIILINIFIICWEGILADTKHMQPHSPSHPIQKWNAFKISYISYIAFLIEIPHLTWICLKCVCVTAYKTALH